MGQMKEGQREASGVGHGCLQKKKRVTVFRRFELGLKWLGSQLGRDRGQITLTKCQGPDITAEWLGLVKVAGGQRNTVEQEKWWTVQGDFKVEVEAMAVELFEQTSSGAPVCLREGIPQGHV